MTPAPERPDPGAQAALGICPVCQNLFRTDGHSFDCPLAAAPVTDAGLREALDRLANASRNSIIVRVRYAAGNATDEQMDNTTREMLDATEEAFAALSRQAEKETV